MDVKAVRSIILFLLCGVLPGFSQNALSQEFSYQKEALKAFTQGSYLDSYRYFTQYFRENGWLGSIEDHLRYAEVLAQVKQSDSAFLHLEKVIGSGHFFDVSRIKGSKHLAPLRVDSRWKPLFREFRKRKKTERRKYVQPLSRNLEKVFYADQQYRVHMDSIIQTYGYPSEAYEVLKGKIEKADHKNQRYIETLLRRKGWPRNLSPRAHRAIFLVIQHGNLPFQKEHEHYIRKAYSQGLIDGQDLALFTDRLLMYQNLPQVYGTQQIYNEEKDAWELYRVGEPETLNARRKQLGLAPVEGYPYQH